MNAVEQGLGGGGGQGQGGGGGGGEDPPYSYATIAAEEFLGYPGGHHNGMLHGSFLTDNGLMGSSQNGDRPQSMGGEGYLLGSDQLLHGSSCMQLKHGLPQPTQQGLPQPQGMAGEATGGGGVGDDLETPHHNIPTPGADILRTQSLLDSMSPFSPLLAGVQVR